MPLIGLTPDVCVCVFNLSLSITVLSPELWCCSSSWKRRSRTAGDGGSSPCVGGLGPKGGSGRLGGFTGLKTMNRGGGGDAGARTAPGLSQGSTRPPWPRGGAGSLLRHAPLRAWHLHLPLITQESTGAPNIRIGKKSTGPSKSCADKKPQKSRHSNPKVRARTAYRETYDAS